MSTKKNDIFDLLNKMIKEAEESGLFSEPNEEKTEPKCECKCEDEECNGCFNAFDPEEFFNGIKEFFGKITSDDIAKPVQTLAELVETGANAVTTLFEKLGDAIDDLNKKYDEAIESEESGEAEQTEEPVKPCKCECQTKAEEPFTFQVSDYPEEDECGDDNGQSVMDFSDDEITSLRKIIEEEYQRRFPEKQENRIPSRSEEIAALIIEKVKKRDFTFTDKNEIKVEITVPLGGVKYHSLLLNEVSNVLYGQYHFSQVHLSSSVKNGVKDWHIIAYLTF